VSFAFITPQDEVGLDFLKMDGGTVTLRFFEPNGTAFDPVLVSGSGNFSRTFTAQAGFVIAGVTLTNVDTYGVAYDDLRLTPADPVSTAPSAWGSVKSLYR
jgi:hypothetical protein